MRISDWSSDVCSSDLVDGKITGFKINGSTSEFLVDADRFAVGNGGDYVFEVVGGVTYIKNAVIQNAAIDADKLSQDVINKVVSATATGVTSTSRDRKSTRLNSSH